MTFFEGEHGAGKSSLINLLLEVDILPVHEYGSTKTFCELQKSANGEKRALCFYKTCPSTTSDPDIIELNNAYGIEDLKKRIIEKNKNEKSPYERIEIFMPFKVLEVSRYKCIMHFSLILISLFIKEKKEY